MFREKMKDGSTRITGTGAASAWPIGSIYLSMLPDNPRPLLGGTWSRFAVGQMLVGVNEGDAHWDYEGKTGGAASHQLTAAELPLHAHAIDHDHAAQNTGNDGGHSHSVTTRAAAGAGSGTALGSGATTAAASTTTDGVHNHPVNIDPYVGSSGVAGSLSPTPVPTLPPYVAVYMWRRTA